MINARAARRFRLAGKTYAKGDPISLHENQFADLAGVGLVERRAGPPPRAVTAKVAARRPTPKRKPAAKKAG